MPPSVPNILATIDEADEDWYTVTDRKSNDSDGYECDEC